MDDRCIPGNEPVIDLGTSEQDEWWTVWYQCPACLPTDADGGPVRCIAGEIERFQFCPDCGAKLRWPAE